MLACHHLFLRVATASGIAGELALGAADLRQTFFAVVVAAEAADASGRGQGFATVVVAAEAADASGSGERFAAVVVAAIFSDAVRHIDFTAEDATACKICGGAGEEQDGEWQQAHHGSRSGGKGSLPNSSDTWGGRIEQFWLGRVECFGWDCGEGRGRRGSAWGLRCEFFALSYPYFACQRGPFGGIIPATVLFRAATKRRTCALSDTLSARVLLFVPTVPAIVV